MKVTLFTEIAKTNAAETFPRRFPFQKTGTEKLRLIFPELEQGEYNIAIKEMPSKFIHLSKLDRLRWVPLKVSFDPKISTVVITNIRSIAHRLEIPVETVKSAAKHQVLECMVQAHLEFALSKQTRIVIGQSLEYYHYQDIQKIQKQKLQEKDRIEQLFGLVRNFEINYNVIHDHIIANMIPIHEKHRAYEKKETYVEIAEVLLKRFYAKHPTLRKHDFPTVKLIAFLLSYKTSEDDAVFNRDIIPLMPLNTVSVSLINRLEIEFLKSIDYNVNVNSDMLNNKSNSIILE